MSELRTRILSGLVAAPIALGATLAHPYSFAALLLAGFVIGLREWERLNVTRSIRFRIAGVCYLALPLACLFWLRQLPFSDGDTLTHGAQWVLALFALVWTTDIAAYVAGRSIGGPKLAPSISPNKTWAGLLGAMGGTAAVATILAGYIPSLSPTLAALCGAALAIVAQAGDFFKSHLKRRAGVKDSGALLPGHGGLLDRIDGLLPASVAFAAFVWTAI